MNDELDADVELMAVAADDLALGAIAGGDDPGRDDVLGLLASLRSDLDLAAAAVQASATSRPATAGGPRPAVRRRPWLPVLTAAAAVGMLAGAVVSQDQPGQPLYAVRSAIFGDDSVAEARALLDDATEDISRARRALDESLLDVADDKIDDARDRIDEVDDSFLRADLDRRATALEADLEAAEDYIDDAADADDRADADADDSPEGSDDDSDPDPGPDSGSGDADDTDSSGSGSGDSDPDSSGGDTVGGSKVGEESGDEASDDDSSGKGSSGGDPDDDALDGDSSGKGSGSG